MPTERAPTLRDDERPEGAASPGRYSTASAPANDSMRRCAKCCEVIVVANPLNGQRIRPSKEVRIGHEIVIRKGPVEWTVIVRALSRQRRPASEAALLYEETEQSRRTRLELEEQRKKEWVRRPLGSGRPTKKERRQLDRLTNR